MNFFQKILGAAVVATLATSVVATSASAHNPNNYKTPGVILPALVGPIGAAALAGSSATTIVKAFQFKIWEGWGWHKVHYLKSTGWNVTKDIHHRYKVKVKATKSSGSKSAMGKAVVGCIFGSALGAISASIRKASAMGNPPRWRSQAEHERIVASGVEKKYELTNDEAHTAVAYCGAGSLTLHWNAI